MSELGERIRRERKRRGERQIDLAERLGTTQATVYRWEIGENRPDIDKFGAVAEYLGMKVDEVYFLAMEAPMPTSLANVQAEIDALRRDRTADRAEITELRADVHDLRTRLGALEVKVANQADAARAKKPARAR